MILRHARSISVLFFLAASLNSFGQNASTSLRGIVQDRSGAVIAGASVSIVNSTLGLMFEERTNSRGEYSFQQVTPGTYVLRVAAAGFRKQEFAVNLLVALPNTINMTLGVAVDIAVVQVSDAAATINTNDASIGNAFDGKTIMSLPSEARNPQTLLALQPGVLYIGQTASTESRNGIVSGARSDQTNIALDGLDNNDQVSPAAFSGVLRIPLDSTEEFRVTTSNASADAGRSSGGQVNLVTRSGSNVIHGAIYEYNRSDLGVANDWFNKQAELASGEVNVPEKLIRNTYGIRLGGPLQRNRFFLFGNYEGNRQNEGVTVVRTVPTASLAAGVLSYPDASGSTVMLSPVQFASMDTMCSGNGTCPNGPGVNAASLALFKMYPLPNGFNTGDGYNTGSYTFSSAVPTIQNVYVARLDYLASARHRFYVRASMQNDRTSTTSSAAYFPGQSLSSSPTDDSKGISCNDTWTVSNTIVNNLRYGFVRQSVATRGIGVGNYTTFRSLDTPAATTRNSETTVPLHNLIDDLTWSKGRHTLQFGANYRRFDYENTTDQNSFDTAVANPAWMFDSGFAGKGGTFDPSAFGLPSVSSNFTFDYDLAVSMLAGLTNEETDNANYRISSDGKSAALLGMGVPVQRSFVSNELEYYVQDVFRPISNLTITAGLRHTILQTPYEVNGQQVQPTIDMHAWFATRAQQAALGNGVQPEISFAPSGQARRGKPFYPMNWSNVAPRLAVVYAPSPENGTWLHRLLGGAGSSSIRAGFGVYYDHYGEGLVANYSRAGSFGLSNSITNPSGMLTADTSPRFAGLHTLPGLVPTPAATLSYPQTPSDDPQGTGFAITTGLDDHLKTPYSEVADLSIQRELRGGFTFEAAYVGRFGRHLLQQLDLAQPLDLEDPGSNTDYYAAATQMSKYVDQHLTTVPAIAYFENLFPDAKGIDTAGDGALGNSATQNIYNDLWQYLRGNETAALEAMDVNCYPGCGGKIGRYWPLQYSSLYVTSSIGSSSYNAGQFILRHAMKHGFQVDISYTYSKSEDMGSDTESNTINTPNNYGPIIDAFHPAKNHGISDFNTTHLLTSDWVVEIPAGYALRSGRAVKQLLGGWSFAGIERLSSGLPFNLVDGDGWSTNWEVESAMVQTGPIKMRKHLDTHGSPQAFDVPPVNGVNLRDPYPGEAGERNRFVGDGYFNVDAGLHKLIPIRNGCFFSLAWEVFNVTNSERFDVHAIDAISTDGSELGVYSAGLTQSRRMQLSGRFEF